MTELSSSYERAASLWLRLLPSYPRLSAPHLVHPTETYKEAQTRLMIVGQETHGWGDNGSIATDQSTTEICEALKQSYQDFNLGWSLRNTPFWSAANRLFRDLNPVASKPAFLWTNLVKMDNDRKRPSPIVEEQIASLELLQAEVRAFKPEVVIFFTGPRYDALLQRTFRDAVLRPVEKSLYRVEHSSLPVNSFRTYHPNYLRLSKQWAILDVIAAQCRSSTDVTDTATSV